MQAPAYSAKTRLLNQRVSSARLYESGASRGDVEKTMKMTKRTWGRSVAGVALAAAMTAWAVGVQSGGAQETTAPSPETRSSAQTSGAVYRIGYVPTDAEFPELVEKVRESALNYATRLKNFIATETERRERRKESADAWKLYSSLVKELSFYEGTEYYRVVSENGKPSKKQWEKVGGARMSGEFGTLLRTIFEPTTQTVFTFEEVEKSDGRTVIVVRFATAKENSRFSLHAKGLFSDRTVAVAARGQCWVDAETLRIVRLEQGAVDIPIDHPIKSMTVSVDYGEVEIGGQPSWLPKRLETMTFAKGSWYRNTIDFTDYHELEVGTSIRFGEVLK